MSRLAKNRDIAAKERRKHILDAATACFVEKGFHQTGMRDIANQADVSLGNLYNYFPSKHDLLVGLAEREMAEIEPFIALLNRSQIASEGLKEFIRVYCDACSDRETAIFYLDITTEAIRQPDIAMCFIKTRAAIAQALSSLISAGINSGTFSYTADVYIMAQLILDLIESATARGVIDGSDPNVLAASIETLVFAALRS